MKLLLSNFLNVSILVLLQGCGFSSAISDLSSGGSSGDSQKEIFTATFNYPELNPGDGIQMVSAESVATCISSTRGSISASECLALLYNAPQVEKISPQGLFQVDDGIIGGRVTYPAAPGQSRADAIANSTVSAWDVSCFESGWVYVRKQCRGSLRVSYKTAAPTSLEIGVELKDPGSSGSIKVDGNNVHTLQSVAGLQDVTLALPVGVGSIEIVGDLKAMQLCKTNGDTVKQVTNFGRSEFTTAYKMFNNCSALEAIPSDQSALDNIISAELMFSGAAMFNQPLSFKTDSVVNMTGMFYGATAFNQDLTNWNVLQVTDTECFGHNSALNPLNFPSFGSVPTCSW